MLQPPHHQLAQFNIARIRYPLDDPRMREFVDNVERVNGLADKIPGFVWRLQDDSGHAMNMRVYDDPAILPNLTVWETVEALERFVWAYLAKEEELAKSPAAFGDAYAKLTGLAPEVSAQAAKIIKLGEVISPDQIKRQAKGFADLGVIQKDVSGEIDAHWDGSFVDKALGK